MIKITWEQFEEQYKPIQNHLDDNASLDGVMFETFGEELEYVTKICCGNPKLMWSYIDDGETSWLESGNHPCNRIGYVLTENPVEEYTEVHEEY